MKSEIVQGSTKAIIRIAVVMVLFLAVWLSSTIVGEYVASLEVVWLKPSPIGGLAFCIGSLLVLFVSDKLTDRLYDWYILFSKKEE